MCIHCGKPEGLELNTPEPWVYRYADLSDDDEIDEGLKQLTCEYSEMATEAAK